MNTKLVTALLFMTVLLSSVSFSLSTANPPYILNIINGTIVTSGGAGTVTSITAGQGLTGGIITSFGTITLDNSFMQRFNFTSQISSLNNYTYAQIASNIGNYSADKAGLYANISTALTIASNYYPNISSLQSSNITTNLRITAVNNSLSNYATITYVNALNNVSLATIQARIDANGNWTLDKVNYATIAYVNALNNVSQATVQALINANGNYSRDQSAIYANITALQSNPGINYYANISNLQTSNTSAGINLAGAYTNITTLSSLKANKTTRINTTGPLFINGASNDNINDGFALSIAQAGSVTGGFLSATDWNIFNNKANFSYVTSLGNWSADKVNYATLLYVNALNNLSQSTVQTLINANGNYSRDQSSIYTNITALQSNPAVNYYANISNLQTSNASAWINLAGAYTNITALQNSPSGGNASWNETYADTLYAPKEVAPVFYAITNSANSIDTGISYTDDPDVLPMQWSTGINIEEKNKFMRNKYLTDVWAAADNVYTVLKLNNSILVLGKDTATTPDTWRVYSFNYSSPTLDATQVLMTGQYTLNQTDSVIGMTSDGTHVYLSRLAGNSSQANNVAKYSFNQTHLNFVSNITYGFASLAGFSGTGYAILSNGTTIATGAGNYSIYYPNGSVSYVAPSTIFNTQYNKIANINNTIYYRSTSNPQGVFVKMEMP